ncbi:MAG: hypothetical protein AAGF12_37900 [Myxococcota bacterium]
MYGGARVTDAVDFYQRRGEVKGAVRSVRDRAPERFRWRSAVGMLTGSAGQLRGLRRARIEEPVREIVLDIDNSELRREIVLDARRSGVDLDRGEVLPHRTVGDLRRLSFLTGIDLTQVQDKLRFPSDFFAPVETAGAILVSRALAQRHLQRARYVWLRIPDPDGPVPLELHHKLMAEHAERESGCAKRWAAFAKGLLEPTPTIGTDPFSL